MSEDTHRRVTIERIASKQYTVTNERGGKMTVGAGDGTDFTPVELLLVALGGCGAIDIDFITNKRAEPTEATEDSASMPPAPTLASPGGFLPGFLQPPPS